VVAGEPAASLIVFGPTQSGKTTGLAVPAILGWEGPVVAASVKTDLLEATAAHRAGAGPVSCFDPSGVTGRGDVTWSPLPESATWPGARRAAATLTEVGRTTAGGMADGDFWYQTASRLLAPLLLAAAVGHRTMADVVRWVETGEEDEVLDLLTWAGVGPAVDAARSAFAKEERQRSSIVTTLETLLEPFGTEAPAAGGPLADLDPVGLLAGSGTLYLCAPAHDQRRLTPLFVGALRTVLDAAYDLVARTGKPLEPPLLVVLDEAANIAPVPDLDALASTAAGQGIQLVTVWHDLAQVTARFGPRAMTVVNNHRAKLFLSGISDPATLDHASHLIGDGERHQAAVTAGGPGGTSTTRSPTVRRLAPPDALRRMPVGSGVLVYRDLPPARLRLRTWSEEPWLRARAGHGAAHPPAPGTSGPEASGPGGRGS
jgi:type IV secretion system protein VirD4